jgi:hypothetical protein
VSQFHAALDDYCIQFNCKKPTPDRPEPSSATYILNKTTVYGGKGGSPF